MDRRSFLKSASALAVAISVLGSTPSADAAVHIRSVHHLLRRRRRYVHHHRARHLAHRRILGKTKIK
jgi:hypothetical protein